MNDKQQLAAMGEHMAEQPMCLAKRIEELEVQVRVMSSLLLELRECAEFDAADGELPADTVERIDAALSGNLPSTTAPEGWKLVPCMPTPEMCDAYHRADNDWEDGWAWDDNGNRHWSPVYQWAAMLAAAPKSDHAK